MELYKLKYFHEVAKLGHVTRAAEQIRIAQPALTQAIHSLEEELGVPLLRKQGRNVALTDYGVWLKERLDRLLPEIDGLKRELGQLKGEYEKRIKLNILAASIFVINAIIAYRRLHPDVSFDFEQNEENRDCDLLITANPLGEKNKRPCLERFVKTERIFLAVPSNSSYAGQSGIDLKDVREEGFVMLSASRRLGMICKKFCAQAGFAPRVLFESDSPSAVQDIISTGTGVAFWPEYAWGRDSHNDNVVLLPVSEPDCRRDLVIERHGETEAAADFYRFLVDKLA